MSTLRTILVFFISGFGAGSFFGWLLSTPSLTTFWFWKGAKFLIPTYRYYLGIGVFLLLGLTLAYSVSRLKGWVLGPSTKSFFRHSFAAIIVMTSALLLYAVMPLVPGFYSDPVTSYLLATVVFVLLISAACWVLTSKLDYPGMFANLLTIPAAFGFLYLLATALNIPGEWSEMVTYPIYYSLLATACGFWIARSSTPQGQVAD